MGVIQNIELKVVDHSVFPGRKVFECWRDGVFIAAIYPHQDGLRIVSKYMSDLVMEEQLVFHGAEQLPSAIIKLEQEVVGGS